MDWSELLTSVLGGLSLIAFAVYVFWFAGKHAEGPSRGAEKAATKMMGCGCVVLVCGLGVVIAGIVKAVGGD